MQWPLHALRVVIDQIIAQIVKTKLIVRTVGHIGAIRGDFLIAFHARQIHTHAQTEKVIQNPHIDRITFGQIIIHGHDVYAFARERVEIHRECGHQGFTLARAHLGNFPLVQNHTTNQLHIKMAHFQHPIGRFTHHRIRLNQERLERCAVLITLFELGGFRGQLLVAQSLHLRF